jgi:hypothetical protein
MVKFIELNVEEIGTGEKRRIFTMEPFDMEKHPEVVKELNTYVNSFNVKIFKYLEAFLKDNYEFDMEHLFMIPEQIAKVGVLEETSYINSDMIRYTKDFIRLMRKGIQDLSKLPVIDYAKKELRDNPFVNILIKFAREWGDIEIDKFFDFFTSMFETFSLNMVICGHNNKPVVVSRMQVQNGILHFNPVPLKFVKKYLTEEVDTPHDIKQIAKDLYSFTKIQTLAFKLDDLIGTISKFNQKNYSFASAILDLIQLTLSSPFYPESILGSMISGLGIDYKKAIPKLKEGFVEFVKLYDRVLIATLEVKPEGKRELDVAFCICTENDELTFRQIHVDNYKEIFRNEKTPVAIDLFEKKLVEESGKEYPFIIVIKMREFKEIFSYENLTSILEMNKFMQTIKGLPSLNKLTDSFSKELSSEDFPKQEEKLESESRTFLEGVPSLDHFLTKGITLKIAEGKSTILTKATSYSGHLGLDIQKLRKFIKINFPEIIKE